MSPAFSEGVFTYTGSDLRRQLTDTRYTYKVEATPLYNGDDVTISIEKTAGDATITTSGNTFTWVPTAGATVSITASLTHDGQTATYTITMTLVGRVS